MKIKTITLSDVEIRETSEGFERVFYNEKKYPAFLTNYSLKKGKELGLIQGSLVKDIFSWGNGDNLGDQFDEGKMLSVIYLAILGASKNFELSYDEFLEKYHATLTESMELYTDLINDLSEGDENKFVSGLKASTSTSKKDKKK